MGQPVERRDVIERTAGLLRGNRVIRTRIATELDAHDLIASGLPSKSLVALTDALKLGDVESALKALGLSLRTLQRKSNAPQSRLTPEQSGRLWKFAEVLGRVTAIFGSQRDAEQWLEQPAIALDQRRPLDLLATAAGIALVEDQLTRMEYGVYS